MKIALSNFGFRWLMPLVMVILIGGMATQTTYAQDDAAEAPATEEMAAEDVAEEPAEEEAPAEPYTNAELDYTMNSMIMFICAVLVLFMQAGFAMVEVGFNASKNAVNIIFKNIMDLSLGICLFMLLGYGLMYPSGDDISPWFAYGGVWTDDGSAPEEIGDYSASADFLFQVAFAATAATIVSGAVAGRMKFSGYLCYSMVLTGIIYPISGYWKWGGGALAEWGFADFAGSVVVHAVGGFAGLAGAMVLGPRIGRFGADGKSNPMLGHNIPLASLGVLILWVGWYGFNPGSQLTYNGTANASVTTYIAVTTSVSAAVGTITATLLSWVLFKKPDLSMALNGALAGLVGITANCDQVSLTSAAIIGAVSGLVVVVGILGLDKLKIDDPVGAFPVHGLCGIWGGLATGIFGTTIPDQAEGSQMAYFIIQLKSTVVICVWAFVTMLLVFFVLKVVGLLRVSEQEEIEGLDMAEHGMPAYGKPASVTGT